MTTSTAGHSIRPAQTGQHSPGMLTGTPSEIHFSLGQSMMEHTALPYRRSPNVLSKSHRHFVQRFGEKVAPGEYEKQVN